jgi:SAM-dependent methyltransferase
MPSQVGQAWSKHFETARETYRIEGGLSFLRKFARAPFVRLPFEYARLGAGSRVLEAGCASGKFSVCFAMLDCSVTALDFSPAMLENAQQLRRAVEREVGALDITFVQQDLENVTLAPDQFALVFNEGVIEHWLDTRARRHVLAQMARVAKPGGTVAVIVPNGQHPLMTYWIEHAPGFISAPPMIRYTPALLRDDLTSVGLTTIVTDGIYAWRTIDQYPAARALQIVGGALQRLIPLPHAVRLKWGIHLIAMGRKV